MGTGNSNKSKDVLRIKTKTLRGKKSTPCLGELNELFNCLTVNNFDDSKCLKQKKELLECSLAAARQPKTANTINYHLQRLGKAFKRAI